MITVYSYTRFSTAAQADGDSVRRQNAGHDATIKRRGWSLSPLSFADLGTSAFRGRNATSGALAKFLAAIKSGVVKAGQGLLIENIDRLSRQRPLKSLKLIEQIIDSKVFVFTSEDQTLYSAETIEAEPGKLFQLLGQMERAYRESQRKSSLLSAAWSQKRKNAAVKPLGKRCPKWIRFDGDRYQLIPERAPLVRRIVKLAIEGHGCAWIAKMLNSEKVKPWGCRKVWDLATVKWLLRTKTLIGIYQPCKSIDGKSVPEGEAIVGYYPAAIDEPTFWKLQSVLDTRKRTIRGRPSTGVSNLFKRLCVNGDDGATMVLIVRKKYPIGYVSGAAVNGASKFIGCQYAAFESAFLRHVPEIVLEDQGQGTSRVPELEGKLAGVRAKISQTQSAAVHSDGTRYARLLEMVVTLEDQERSIIEELENEKARENRPTSSVADIEKLSAALATAKGDELISLRQRLQGAIQSVVDRVTVYTRRYSNVTLVLAAVTLRDGLTRLFTIRQQQKRPTVSVGCSRAFSAGELDGGGMADSLAGAIGLEHSNYATFASGFIAAFEPATVMV